MKTKILLLLLVILSFFSCTTENDVEFKNSKNNLISNNKIIQLRTNASTTLLYSYLLTQDEIDAKRNYYFTRYPQYQFNLNSTIYINGSDYGEEDEVIEIWGYLKTAGRPEDGEIGIEIDDDDDIYFYDI